MKILIATTRPPWPARRGLERRAAQWAAWLARQHEVTVIFPSEAGGERGASAAPAEVRAVAVAGSPAAAVWGVARAAAAGGALQAGLYRQPAFERAFVDLAAQSDLVVLQLARLVPLARRIAARGGPRLWVDLVDSLAANARSRANVAALPARPFWRLEARRLEALEGEALARAERCFVVSERDRAELLVRHAGAAERLTTLTLAVEPGAPPMRRPPSDPPTVAITGNLGYFATRDGIDWFFAEVWPKVRAADDRVRLRVAGSRAPRGLAARLAGFGGDLTVEPDDLVAWLANATVAAVPLRAGSGLPVKLLEAWAAGVPVVATDWAAAGVGGRDGVDLAIGQGAEGFARALLATIADPTGASARAAAGLERMRRDFDPEALAARLLAWI